MRISWNMSPVWLCLLAAFYLASALNLGFWEKIAEIYAAGDSISLPVLLTVPLALTALLNLALLPLSARRLIKPVLTFIILTAALFNYAMFHYGVIFDDNMFANVVQTDIGESSSYLSATFIIELALMAALPLALLWIVPLQKLSIKKAVWQRGLSAVLSVALVAGIAAAHFDDYAAVGRNNKTLRKVINPVYPYKQAYKYIHETYFDDPVAYRELAQDIKRKDAGRPPRLIVMVLGETQRGMNYSLNGYERPTNPYTEKLGVTSFRHVRSYGTATTISVPYMFSLTPENAYDADIEPHQDNVIDAIARSGAYMSWLDNDSGCKGVCKKIETRNLREEYTGNTELCPHKGSCYDAVFIETLGKMLENPIEKDTVITLHVMGSHGPSYWQRYPDAFRVFTPDCPQNDIQNCERQALVNTYDNTIVYSDYVLSEIIELIKTRQPQTDSSMIFMSDHGESLGEKGIYLHGMPRSIAPAEQHHVPFIVWMSDSLRTREGMNTTCLARIAAETKIDNANLSSTLLGIMGLETKLYDPARDYLAPCRGARETPKTVQNQKIGTEPPVPE